LGFKFICYLLPTGTTDNEFVIDLNFLLQWFGSVRFVVGYKQTYNVGLNFANTKYTADYNLYYNSNPSNPVLVTDKNGYFAYKTDLLITLKKT